jgi:hypothetical protein
VQPVVELLEQPVYKDHQEFKVIQVFKDQPDQLGLLGQANFFR